MYVTTENKQRKTLPYVHVCCRVCNIVRVDHLSLLFIETEKIARFHT